MVRSHRHEIKFFRSINLELVYISFCFPFLFLHAKLPAGLKLKLFIEQSQYIPELSHTAGARVVIHDQGQTPFPDNEGNDVLPSRSTSFAIRKV